MADDVVLNKAAVIERCVARVREEYAAAGDNFATNFTHQDAADLNIPLKKMIGFRNIAVHEYQRLLLPITENVITAHLDEFLAYASALVRRDAAQQGSTPSA